MRLLRYKCPKDGGWGCIYDMIDDGNACLNCGASYYDTLTIWGKIELMYHSLVPYEWRPKNVWYAVKCYCWKRYTTIKPRTLDHMWVDRCDLLLHMNFEILSQFVEKELRVSYVDWDADEQHRQARDKMEELYAWWQNHNKIEDWCGMDLTARHEEEQTKLKELIDVRPFLWT